MTNPMRSVNDNNSLNKFFSHSLHINWEVLIFIVILLIAIFTRFYILGERVMSHDESLHTRFAHDLYDRGDFQHSPLMHGPILFHAVALSYTLFGDTDFAARIYTAALGVLLVMSPILFRHWLGRWGTILASIMFLISPLIVYYNRYIRHDTPSILSAIIMLWAIFMYLSGPDNQRRQPYWLYILAFGMIWNLGSKETAFIYIAIIGIFLALYWGVRLLQYFFGMSGKSIFYTAIVGILLGGVMSLGMYIVVDVLQFDLLAGPDETGLFGSLVAQSPELLENPELLASRQAQQATERQTFIVWTTTILFSVFGVMLSTLFWAYRGAANKIKWRDVGLVCAIALAVVFVLVMVEEFSHLPDAETAAGEPLRWWPMLLLWLATMAGFVLLFITRRRHEETDDDKDKAGRGFWGTMDLFPELDLIIVIGTLILPWSTAIFPFMMKGTTADYAAVANVLPAFLRDFMLVYVPQVGSPEQIGRFLIHVMAWLPLMALAISIGLIWNWKRWLIASAIFHVIFAFFFTTIFTNIAGLASGMVYSLGYWLEQQGERRGSQPQYYYLLIIMPFYEFLPALGGFLSMFAGMTLFWRRKKQEDEVRDSLHLALLEAEAQPDEGQETDEATMPDAPQIAAPVSEERSRMQLQERINHLRFQNQNNTQLVQLPFILFVAWLAVLNLVGYSLAGEKMPWLGTHLTTPLIFLTAWFFGRIINRIDWAKFRKRGWIIALITTFGVITFIRLLQPFLFGPRPFAGLSSAALSATYGWLAALALFIGAIYAISRLKEDISWQQVSRLLTVTIFTMLAVVTFRSAWIASFINYDLPTEFLVYAHSAPAVKGVLERIEELSLRTTDGYDIRVAYDNEVSWPYSWYLRNYDNAIYVGENPTVRNLEDAAVVVIGANHLSDVEPILEDRYQRFDHIRMWWPMQDYFDLTVDDMNNLLDFSPSNGEAAQVRRGVFDIWWSRDYSTYDEAVSGNFNLTEWPVSDRMHFYVRKDFAAQIWPYGVGDGTVANPLDEIAVNVCTTNWQPLEALSVLESPLGLTNPIGIAIAPDGSIYVAEEFGHRVAVFDAGGNFVDTIGQEGFAGQAGINFQRPNSLAFSPDGNLIVADTWNFRIQVLNLDTEEMLTSWGQSGTFGFDAPLEPADGFWGPRDVAVDSEGRIFVADTGNKRIRVYEMQEAAAVHLYDIAEGGSSLGQIDEPSGLAIHSDGRLFVADTWNRRISVFSTDGGFFDTYQIRGWYEEQGNRPYLAIDEIRNLLYVTDPDAGRVLVYTTGGDCVGSFGEPASSSPTGSEFGIAAGIAVDSDGFVYVVDNQLGRVLKFEPFEFVPETPVESDVSESDAVSEDDFDAETTADSAPIGAVSE